MQSPLRPLRWVALLGVALVLIARLVQSFPLAPRWWIGGLLLVALTVAVTLVAVLMMPGAAGTLARNFDLLVPLGLLLLAQEAMGLMLKLPLLGTALGASHSLTLLNLPFALSLHWLLNLALAAAYATWVTAAILNLVRSGQSDPCAGLPTAFRHLLRVAGFMFVGWCGVFVFLALMGLAMRFMNWFAILLALPALIAWNFATAAALPVALLTEGGFLSALRAGFIVSLAKLLLIWDGAMIHRSRLVRAYLESLQGRLYAAALPAYAPELNPIEYLRLRRRDSRRASSPVRVAQEARGAAGAAHDPCQRGAAQRERERVPLPAHTAEAGLRQPAGPADRQGERASPPPACGPFRAASPGGHRTLSRRRHAVPQTHPDRDDLPVVSGLQGAVQQGAAIYLRACPRQDSERISSARALVVGAGPAALPRKQPRRCCGHVAQPGQRERRRGRAGRRRDGPPNRPGHLT